MPQVPYSPVPDVNPNFAPAPDIRTPSNLMEAFGAGIGQAVSHLGKVAEGAGEELFNTAIKLQDMKNAADARAATIDFAKQSASIEEEFKSKLGADAGPEALKDYNDRLTKLHETVAGNLKTPIAQKYYREESQNFLLRSIFSNASHSGDQIRQYAHGQNAAMIQLGQNAVVQDPTNDKLFNETWGDVERRIKAPDSALSGASPEQQDAAVAKERSNLWAARINALADKDPPLAAKLYAEHKGELDRRDAEHLQIVVNDKVNTLIARNEARKLTEDMRDAGTDKNLSEGERMEKVETEIRKKYGDQADVNMVIDKARHFVGQEYKYNEGVKKDFVQKQEQTLYDTINKNDPKNLDELLALPENKAAYEALLKRDPKAASSWQAKVEHMHEAKNRQTERTASLMLKGMEAEDPEQFLSIKDFADPKYHLSRDDAIKMRMEQVKISKEKDKIPRIGDLITLAHGKYGDVIPDKTNNPTGYWQFVGALLDGKHFLVQKGKDTADEEEKMIDRITRQYKTESGFFFDTKPYGYEIGPEEGMKAKLRKNWHERFPDKPELSESELREWYRQTTIEMLEKRGDARPR